MMSNLETRSYCPECGSGPRYVERVNPFTGELAEKTNKVSHRRCQNCGNEWSLPERDHPPELAGPTIGNRVPVAVMAFFTGMFTAIWAGGHTAPTITPRVSGYLAVATALVTLGFILMDRGDSSV